LKNKKENGSVLEKGETFEQKRNFEGVCCIPTHGGWRGPWLPHSFSFASMVKWNPSPKINRLIFTTDWKKEKKQ